jgi:hypothetical protein
MVARTLAQALLFIARTRTVMNQNKIGNRVVLIGRPAPASEKTSQAATQRPMTSRIVVIRNGEPVGRKP